MIVCDAGSGIRAMSQVWNKEFGEQTVEAYLVFTHLHWDHIQGFPFFALAYQPGHALTIFGEHRPRGGIGDLLSGQMEGDYFPIPLSAMQAKLIFRDTSSDFFLDEVRVTTFALPHPGSTLGYRFETADSVFVLATDCELDQVALNADEIARNYQARRSYDQPLLDFLRDVDLLVIDCQYTNEEYPARRGWGHNALATVADLCAQVRPRMVSLFHHDPQRTDQQVMEMVEHVDQRLKQWGVEDVSVFAAREGLTMRVASLGGTL